jgi:Protein of unknown function (DUF3568)
MGSTNRVITRFVARVGALAGAAAALSGCQALAITAAGVGASAGLTHTASSISYRTFTASDQQVRQATLMALGKMGVKVDKSEKKENTETIRASVADRTIEIELEAMSKSATRISAYAQRSAFLYDAATAREIVAQTEIAMAELAQEHKPRAAAKSTSSFAAAMNDAVRARR